jgi:hypothetical protein
MTSSWKIQYRSGLVEKESTKPRTWLWATLTVVHMFVFALSWMLLLFLYGWDESQPFVYRASASYWWYWINLYISIRLQIKMLLPLMEKHVKEDKPGYLDLYIERFKAWLISFVGGEATAIAE